MNSVDNFRAALEGKPTDFTPCYFGNASVIVSSAIRNKPAMGSNGGKDWWGVEWSLDKELGSFSPAVGVENVLQDITNWRNEVTFPDISDIDWEAAYDRDKARIDRNKVVIYIANNGLFERLHFLMGFENAIYAIMEDPEAVAEFVSELADFYIQLIEKIGKYYKPEYFNFMDDYTYKDGLLVTYDAFDEIFAPALKRIVKAVEDNGMKYIEHCCGKSELMLDRFYDCGIRRLDPCQPVNNLNVMMEKYPDMVFLGGLDVQNLVDVPGVTEEAIRKEVRRCIDTYGKAKGNYIIYGALVSLHDPAAYEPGGKIWMIMDEANKYTAVM